MGAVILDADGNIPTGAPVYVAEGILSFTPELETEEGSSMVARSWAGSRQGPEGHGEQVEKYWNLSGEMATKDWALFSALTGDTRSTDGPGNTVGIQLPLRNGGIGRTAKRPLAALVIVTAATSADASGGGCGPPGEGATECVGQFWPLTSSWAVGLSEKTAGAPRVSFKARAYGSRTRTAGVLNLWPISAIPDSVNVGSAVGEVFVDCGQVPELTENGSPLVHPKARVHNGPTLVIGDSNTTDIYANPWVNLMACSVPRYAVTGIGVREKGFFDKCLERDHSIMMAGWGPGRHVAVMLGTNDVILKPWIPTSAELESIGNLLITVDGAASVRWVTMPPLDRTAFSPSILARYDAWQDAIMGTSYPADLRAALGPTLLPIHAADDRHMNTLGQQIYGALASRVLC